jgi:hypothetical protein
MITTAVFMDPRRIAHDLCQPLRDTLANIRTENPHRRRQGVETLAAQKHQSRSEASQRAWLTIRNNQIKKLQARASRTSKEEGRLKLLLQKRRAA